MSGIYNELEEAEMSTDLAGEQISLADINHTTHASNDTMQQTLNSRAEDVQPESLKRSHSGEKYADETPSSFVGSNIITERVHLDEEEEYTREKVESLQVSEKPTRSLLPESEKLSGMDLRLSKKMLEAETTGKSDELNDERIKTPDSEENTKLDEDEDKDNDDEKGQRNESNDFDFLEDDEDQQVVGSTEFAGSSFGEMKSTSIAYASPGKRNSLTKDEQFDFSERNVVPRESPDVIEPETKIVPRESPDVIERETKVVPRESPDVVEPETKVVPREIPDVIEPEENVALIASTTTKTELETQGMTIMHTFIDPVHTENVFIESGVGDSLQAGVVKDHAQNEGPQTNFVSLINEPETTDVPIGKEPINQSAITDVPIDKETINQSAITDVPIEKEPINQSEITYVPIDKEPINQSEITDVPIDKEPINQSEIADVPRDKEPINQSETTDVPIDNEPMIQSDTTDVPIEKEPINKSETTHAPINKKTINESEITDVPIDKAPISKPETRDLTQINYLITKKTETNVEYFENFCSQCENYVAATPESYKEVQNSGGHHGVLLTTETKTHMLANCNDDNDPLKEEMVATLTPQEDKMKTSFDLSQFATSSLTLLRQSADGAHGLVSCNIKPHAFGVISESTREPNTHEAMIVSQKAASSDDVALSPIKEDSENFDNFTSNDETSRKNKDVDKGLDQNFAVELEKSGKNGNFDEAENASRDSTPSKDEQIEEISKDAFREESLSLSNTVLAGSQCSTDDLTQGMQRPPAVTGNMSRMILLTSFVIIIGVASAVAAPFALVAAGFESGGVVAGSLAESLMELSSSTGFGLTIIDIFEEATNFNAAVQIFIGLFSGAIAGCVFLATGMFWDKFATVETSGKENNKQKNIRDEVTSKAIDKLEIIKDEVTSNEKDVLENIRDEVTFKENNKLKNVRDEVTFKENDKLEIIKDGVTSKANDKLEIIKDEVTSKENDKLEIIKDEVTSKENDKLEFIKDEVTSQENDKLEIIKDEATSKENDKLEIIKDEVTSKENDKLEIIKDEVTSNENDKIEDDFVLPESRLGEVRSTEIVEEAKQ